MDFLQKLDSMMEKYSLNRRSLSQKSGIPYTTIDGWYKKGYEGMKISTLRILADYFNTLLDFWIQDDITNPNYGKCEIPGEPPPSYSEGALKLADAYDNDLDNWGRQAVRELVETEVERCRDETQLRESPLKEDPKVIPLYWSPAAAGLVSPILGQEYDAYELKPEDPQGAVFAVKVDGDSMEPYFPDGSIAFCNKDPIADGEIGVFCLDGDSFIKQYHYDPVLRMTYLFSLNRKRSDADKLVTSTSGQTLTCMGRVMTRKRPPLPGLG